MKHGVLAQQVSNAYLYPDTLHGGSKQLCCHTYYYAELSPIANKGEICIEIVPLLTLKTNQINPFKALCDK
jgi:hypothetical protein